jgi:ketosteroid isomerase-like protein
MSEENTARFMEATDAFNRLGSDVENLDQAAFRRWLSAMDPEIRFEPQQVALQGTYFGHEGAMQWLGDLAEHYGAGEVRYDEIHDLGDRVLGLGAIHFVGRGSNLATDVPAAILMTFKDGLITRLQDFGGDRARALEIAGLSE